MGVGTIPILQYADLFYPKLEHTKNCLLFTNYAELYEAVRIASTMTPEQISIMKKNVIDYFEEYLAPDAIVRKIKKFSESNQKQVNVSIPYIM
jgi:hypothetical protein